MSDGTSRRKWLAMCQFNSSVVLILWCATAFMGEYGNSYPLRVMYCAGALLDLPSSAWIAYQMGFMKDIVPEHLFNKAKVPITDKTYIYTKLGLDSWRQVLSSSGFMVGNIIGYDARLFAGRPMSLPLPERASPPQSATGEGGCERRPHSPRVNRADAFALSCWALAPLQDWNAHRSGSGADHYVRRRRSVLLQLHLHLLPVAGVGRPRLRQIELSHGLRWQRRCQTGYERQSRMGRSCI